MAAAIPPALLESAAAVRGYKTSRGVPAAEAAVAALETGASIGSDRDSQKLPPPHRGVPGCPLHSDGMAGGETRLPVV